MTIKDCLKQDIIVPVADETNKMKIIDSPRY